MAALPPTRVLPIKNDPSKIQLERLSHVYFEYKDLDKFVIFAKDFGFQEAYSEKDVIVYRGYGKDPFLFVARKSADGVDRFGGGAWVAQTEADFNKAASLKGAKVSELSPFPGGGRKVTVSTPAGFLFHVVYGQEERKVTTVVSAQVENTGPYNGSLEKRRLGDFNDSIKNEDLDVVAFVHLDLGERYTDHHSLFLARAGPGEKQMMHHTSFEVEDFDTQLLGHDWLARKGYKAVWGIGRHILGSQIFDYWEDTGGFTIEHYADGDLVNSNTKTERSKAGPLAVWGPEFPPGMVLD